MAGWQQGQAARITARIEHQDSASPFFHGARFFFYHERRSEIQAMLVRLPTSAPSALMTECRICSLRFEH